MSDASWHVQLKACVLAVVILNKHCNIIS